MTKIYFVDFSEKKLLGIKTIEDDQEVNQTDLDKFKYFSELISENLTLVRVNTSSPGVNLPPSVKESPVAIINWSHKFKIFDFEYDVNSVRGTLSFNNKLHYTVLPWESITGISHPGGAKSKEW